MEALNMRGITRKQFLGTSAKAAASAFAGPLLVPALTLTGCSSASSLVRKGTEIDYMKEIRFVNCRLVDVMSGKVIENGMVRMMNSRVLSAGRAEEVPDTGAEVFDLKGMYVMPGLINGHCHMTLPPAQFLKSVFRATELLDQMKMNYLLNIKHGITSVRDMGGYPGLLEDYMKEMGDGELPGPRVVKSNSFLSVKGGYIEIDESDLHPLGGLFMGLLGGATSPRK